MAPSSAAALTVNGPGLIQSQASGSGAAGAIRIGSISTTATSVDNGAQIKASGTGAMVDLLSSGTTTFQGGGNIEATGGSIKLNGANTTIKGGSLTANQGGSITVNGSSNAEVSGGSLQAYGGTITISSVKSTALGNTSLIANSVNSGGALKKGQIVVGGSLSGTPASATANSNTTTLASGARLSANGGGRIDVLSTGRTSSNGNLEASGGVINLAGDTSTISGGSLTADQGGSISVLGSNKASISGGSLSSTNSGSSSSGGSITLEGATVSLTGTGKVNTTTSGSGAGAAITVKTGTLDLASGTELSTKSSDSGTSGAITVTPSSAAALTVNGPGLIQSLASGNGKSGAIRIGSSSTSGTSVDNGVQIKATGSGAKVELLSSGTTSFQGGGSIEATRGSIKLDGVNTTISGDSPITADGGGRIDVLGTSSTSIGTSSLTAKSGSIFVTGGEIKVGSTSGRTILLAGNGGPIGDESDTIKTPNLTLLDGGSGSSPAINLQGGENKTIQIFSGSATPATAQGITSVRGATTISATPPPLTTPATAPAHRIVIGGVLSGTAAEPTATSSVTTISGGSFLSASDGGRIAVLGTSGATIEASSLTAKSGSIAVDGGEIKVGSTSGRTILLAGNGALITDPNENQDEITTPNLTLLDGGSDKSSAITLKGGMNKSIQIYSGSSEPEKLKGLTTLRGCTNVIAPLDNTSAAQSVVVGGLLSGAKPTMMNTSIVTTLGKGALLETGIGGQLFILGDRVNSQSMLKSDSILTTTEELTIDNNYLNNTVPINNQTLSFFDAEKIVFQGEISLNNINFKAFKVESKYIEFNDFTLTKQKNQSPSLAENQQIIWNPGDGRTAITLYSTLKEDPSLSNITPGISINNTTFNLDASHSTNADPAGVIKMNAINSSILIKNSSISAKSLAGSNSPGGDIGLTATSITVDNSKLNVQTESINKGGSIKITTSKLNLRNAANLTVETSYNVGAGDININNDDAASASTSNNFVYDKGQEPTSDNAKSFINAQTTDSGKGGSIFLGSSGPTLTISGAGTITAETKGSGKGGDINLSGTTISIKGDPKQGDLKVTAQTSATGAGGTIRVNADSLDLSGAKTQLSTLADKGSSGDAGLIFLKANSINLN
ncbi:MAG: beta strand repeat-containing protein, partial [Synechococcaceae cyanobacterium]